jgi:AraC-like DNA-binding protein
VAAIGHACGFVDQSAFARQFKAAAGVSPRDYRKLVALPSWARAGSVPGDE